MIENRISDRAKILLIDEDTSISYLIRRAMEKENYKIYIAGSGKQGMEMSTGVCPDLILMDNKFSDMEGITLILWFREWTPRGAEALVRWKKPDGTMVSPGEFIPVFEKNGFIIKLDYYVWDQVCQLIATALRAGRKPDPISVNVSRVNLYNPNFLESLVNLVEKYRIPPEYLHLELTESVFSDTENVILNAVNYLHKAGFTILMDDFGSGYSSLNVLKDIDLDVLKIDMKFLSKGKDDGRGEKILAAVIQMAKALDMPVIAEGVEEKKQVQMLKRLGCNYIQGYYFAKPMPQEDYERLARKSHE